MARTVFKNANLLDGNHPAKPDSTIVVEGNRITIVASGSVDSTADDKEINCTGLTVMPGMVTGHYHSTYHKLVNEYMPPLGLDYPPAYQALIGAYNVRLALEAGFTAVVGANASSDVDASLVQGIAEGLIVGPRVVAASRELITSSDSNDLIPWWWDSQSLTSGTRICNGPEEFRRGVRDEIKRGAEMIKLFASGGHGVRLPVDLCPLTQEELNAAVETAHSLGKRARAHVASKRGLMMCFEAGIDVIDHGDEIDDECIKIMAEREIPWIPSIHGIFRVLELMGDADPKTGFKSEFGRIFRRTAETIPAAVEGGVKVCLGDDYGSTVLAHGAYGRELGMFGQWVGVPPLEIIRWATVNGGALVGLDDLGRIEQGALADIVVVNGNPLDDLDLLGDVENIRVVMRDGRVWIDRLGG
jgi:imidazolonepropionase-like amidohydrolase